MDDKQALLEIRHKYDDQSMWIYKEDVMQFMFDNFGQLLTIAEKLQKENELMKNTDEEFIDPLDDPLSPMELSCSQRVTFAVITATEKV